MTEKQFKINTSQIGYIYIDNLKGEHMSWIELEKTLNRLYAQNKELFKENKELKIFKDKVFALIDARIEIYKHKPFMAPVSAPMSVNFDEDTDRLGRLSELEQLKEELSE